MRTFPEAPAAAVSIDRAGTQKPEPGHPLTHLMQTPNPYYGGELLWGATYVDFTLSGNAYWLKQRAGTAPGSPVVALWWVPSAIMEPRWPEADPTVYISHYDYKPTAGAPLEVAPADVVHFRNGLDPLNIRKGLSPLLSLAREIVSDDEANQWTAALLHNMGVPGVVLVPGKDVEIDENDAEEIKQRFAQRTTGDRRGEPLVLDNAVDIKTVGFSPQQMMPSEMRALSETRISGVLGIPSIVAGLEAGLRRSTFSNFGEARQAAYEGNILPTQRQLAGDLRVQLVPDFGDPETLAVVFDTSKIRILQEDESAKLQRIMSAVGGPIMTLNEARQAAQLQPLPGSAGDVVYVPINLTPTPVDQLVGLGPPSPPPPPTLPPGGGPPEPPPPGEKRWGIKAVTVEPPSFDAARWVQEYRQIRRTLESDAFAGLRGFFAEQRDRIIAALDQAGPDASVNELIDVTVEAARLRLELDPHYLAALTLLQNAVQTQLGIRYTFSQEATQTYLATCGAQIVGITETTRDAVRDSLIQSADLGESPPEMAARLRTSTAFSPQRARVVSRTELGSACNTSTYYNFAASDVVTGVTVLDGEEDDVCAEANGTELTMDDFADYPRLGHPNCVRAFSPTVAA